MGKTTKVCALGVGILFSLLLAVPPAISVEIGIRPSIALTPTGPHVMTSALVPTLRKWYLPQELYREYGWKSWEYTNYAKTHYARYVDINLEGSRFYDIYGDYITRGWKVYDWTENQPALMGNMVRKSPYYERWFDNVLVSSSSKGQFYTAITVGNAIRTTLTPMTFSKPTFNGIQWDFLTDKYSLTALLSRISDPTMAVSNVFIEGIQLTNSKDLYGLRGTVQVGDFVKLGGTYVNAHNLNTARSFTDNSLKGVLTEGQNSRNIENITIRLSDDSPEDGVGGAVLYDQCIIIDGRRHPELTPLIKGGLRVGGLLVANGTETITLTYDIRHKFTDYDYKLIKKIEFELVLANDYKVEVTSNVQLNTAGEQVFLPVTRAKGNVKDGSNQCIVRFMYGLPTANEIYGFTVEITKLRGFDLYAEWDVNRRFRRFPNVNYSAHPWAMDKSSAYCVTASQIIYPWFAYAEVFSMDPDYTTFTFIPNPAGDIDYEDTKNYRFEFVDDNDDQDRYPDWNRKDVNQTEGYDRAVFPGLDENNDLLCDFNQNDNLYPDYEEPFLRYSVDPPEYLFGMDMNNNGTIDRFENDNLPDYPYKKDHRGYNFYGGVEIVPGVRAIAGYTHEWLISSDRRSKSTYALLTVQQNYPRIGRIQVFNLAKRVRDNIADDLYQWVQLPLSKGTMQAIPDPLVQQNTFVNTSYLQFDYTGIRGLGFVNKLKYESYRQKGSQKGVKPNARFFGIINKLGYSLRLGERMVITPRIKSMYENSKDIPGTWGFAEKKELWEIFSLLLDYNIFAKASIKVGYEGTIFKNYLTPSNPKQGDHYGNVIAVQFSNISDYLGYKLTSKVGFRWERLSFPDLGTSDTRTVAFLRMYAGIEK